MEKETAKSEKEGVNLLIRPVEGLENNFLITDKNGYSHEMVELVGTEGFPVHLVDDKPRRVFIGKYQASVVDKGYYRTYKDGMVAHSVNFDRANEICNDLNNGDQVTGFHLMTNAEWAAVALLSHEVMKGERVQGNNNCCKDYTSKKLMGTPEPGNEKHPVRWLAGSGGVKTSHNGNESGIYDLNGNIFEWVKGLRLMDGEIQIIPDNNAALTTADVSKDSAEWRAILEDGSLVEPGTAGTLKFDSDGNISKTTGRGWSGKKFKSIECHLDDPHCAGMRLLGKLLVSPIWDDLHDDYFWWDTNGEDIPVRGGDWLNGVNAGLFHLSLLDTRVIENVVIGFRVAFVL